MYHLSRCIVWELMLMIVDLFITVWFKWHLNNDLSLHSSTSALDSAKTRQLPLNTASSWTQILKLESEMRPYCKLLEFIFANPNDCWLSQNVLLPFVCNFLGDKWQGKKLVSGSRIWRLELGMGEEQRYGWLNWKHFLPKNFLYFVHISMLHPWNRYSNYISLTFCILQDWALYKLRGMVMMVNLTH